MNETEVCKCNDNEKRQIKKTLLQYDRTFLVADPRKWKLKKDGRPIYRSRIKKLSL